MHLCDKCLGTIPNHLPDQRVCSRCEDEDMRPVRLTSDKPKRVVEFAQVQNENKQLRELLGVLIRELPFTLSPEAQLAYVKAKRLLEGGGE